MLNYWENVNLRDLLKIITGKAQALSLHKYSSHIVELILDIANHEERIELVRNLIGS
jgi:hypothetical protein